jgi:hypothetical protein
MTDEDKGRTQAQLKLKIHTRSDGSIYEMLLYTEPNAGHGWKPIARFYPEFTDALPNAEHIVALWNDFAKCHAQIGQELIQEIEGISHRGSSINPKWSIGVEKDIEGIFIPMDKWQALKEREGVK